VLRPYLGESRKTVKPGIPWDLQNRIRIINNFYLIETMVFSGARGVNRPKMGHPVGRGVFAAISLRSQSPAPASTSGVVPASF
jgi:hypothetical protein